MFCPTCGKEIAERDVFCRFCGRSLSPDKPPSSESQLSASVTAPLGGPEQALRRSGEATASLILGLFSFVPVIGLLAVIFGHLALASIRRSGGRLLGEGMAAWGLLLGYVGLGVWVIYGLSVLIRPVLSPPSSRRADNEKFALMLLKTINTSATTYASMYDHGFPPSLAAFGPPKSGNANAGVSEIVKAENAQAAGFITEMEASGTYFGYGFTYVAGKANRSRRIETYTVHADPVTPGVTGESHFFTDESQAIRVETGKEADQHSPPIWEK